jgi:hypothetical protein
LLEVFSQKKRNQNLLDEKDPNTGYLSFLRELGSLSFLKKTEETKILSNNDKVSRLRERHHIA